MDKLLWYAYRHELGSIHVKRYFDVRDIRETRESDFVRRVEGPFEADTRDEALVIAVKLLTGV